MNTEVILHGRGSDINVTLPHPILIPEGRIGEIALKNFTTFMSVPNIDEHNNTIRVRKHDTWKTLKLETGAYEISGIAQVIRTLATLDEDKFQLLGNDATSKCEFIFKEDYGVDFNVEASLGAVLGFERRTFQGIGHYVATKIANISLVNQFIFNCNLSESNYINDQLVTFLYNTPVDSPPGYRFSKEIVKIAYKKLNTNVVRNIRIWITDEKGLTVNLRRDVLIVTLIIRYE